MYLKKKTKLTESVGVDVDFGQLSSRRWVALLEASGDTCPHRGTGLGGTPGSTQGLEHPARLSAPKVSLFSPFRASSL